MQALNFHKLFLVEPGLQFQLNHAKHGFAKDATAHLAGSQHAVHKHDGHFLDFEAHGIGGKFHFYLEGIALELDVVKVDGLKHFTLVADEAGRGVVNLHAGDNAHIDRGKVAHDNLFLLHP